ncbi:tryptophan synthase subunit beta [Candidatus Vidania fulgoroideorum]
MYKYPNKKGFFGKYGGSYVSKEIKEKLNELKYFYYKKKKKIIKKFKNKIKKYTEKPSNIYFARNLSKKCKIFLKREDNNFTNSHKINNTIGQLLIAKMMNKKEVICETGAGQHGISVAHFCKHFNIECKIFMGYKDSIKQSSNVKKMLTLGAKLYIIKRGGMGLTDSINEAMEYWNSRKKSYYLVGSVVGPHPFPLIVRNFQSIIGYECYKKIKPDYILACIGGGSNAIGIFYKYIKKNTKVKMIGVEACGNNKKNSVFRKGKVGILHGCKTLLLKKNNLLLNIDTISSGLNYPSVGPEHSFLFEKKIVDYKAVSNKEALIGFKEIIRKENIIPSIESSHAIFKALEISKKKNKKKILVNLSGSGEKDLNLIK